MGVAPTYQLDTSEIHALQSRRLASAAVRAMKKAGSTALRDMKSEASKSVREQKRIKAKQINRAMRLVRPRGSRIEDMEWSLQVADLKMRVADYPHRQTRRGVSAQINRGSRSLIRGAFVATMRSGHRGVFVRRGRRRLPIEEMFSSRVIDVIGSEKKIQRVHRRGVDAFNATWRRMFDAEMQKER